ncbi:hypothetical protein CTEN210_10451 [Chaetoceros tenuissimus]|uniref:Uncharacterized protein n=1 Tax=Chaetoceros tenuissimus TaxID=426638 RepID=A0AAD3H865_9STRA|nr:hypothetical protein CTEN210_10451 [Chaetoceros tenuissimus]
MPVTDVTTAAAKAAASPIKEDVEEQQPLINSQSKPAHEEQPAKGNAITSTGFKVLALLAFQNSFKNILMRVVMKDHGGFLLSTAITMVELLKLLFSVGYIVLIQERNPFSVITYIKNDWRNTLLLCVPATAYSFQMSMEYVAMANIDPSTFSVLVQMKMLTTALFFRTILKKRLMKKQFMSLIILTVGVMLCSMKTGTEKDEKDSGNKSLGIAATLGIACSSGFASVYTEKVIKTARKNTSFNKEDYGLAYMQAQLAIVSLVVLGLYAFTKDFKEITQNGFFHNYDIAAFCSSLNSAVGGLIVAAVLKFANSVLKGYATAVSVVLTTIASNIMFGTQMSLFFVMGSVNCCMAVLLYNASGLDDFMC